MLGVYIITLHPLDEHRKEIEKLLYYKARSKIYAANMADNDRNSRPTACVMLCN
jgi:hypothetical protein